MKALLVNCTLKPSPEKSNAEALAEVVADALRDEGVEVALVRAVDHSIPPGVESEMGEGDEWPGIRSRIVPTIKAIQVATWKNPSARRRVRGWTSGACWPASPRVRHSPCSLIP